MSSSSASLVAAIFERLCVLVNLQWRVAEPGSIVDDFGGCTQVLGQRLAAWISTVGRRGVQPHSVFAASIATRDLAQRFQVGSEIAEYHAVRPQITRIDLRNNARTLLAKLLLDLFIEDFLENVAGIRRRRQDVFRKEFLVLVLCLGQALLECRSCQQTRILPQELVEDYFLREYRKIGPQGCINFLHDLLDMRSGCQGFRQQSTFDNVSIERCHHRLQGRFHGCVFFLALDDLVQGIVVLIRRQLLPVEPKLEGLCAHFGVTRLDVFV